MPANAPTLTAVPAATSVGKLSGNGCSSPSGSLDSTRLPSPLLSVVTWPTTVAPTVTSSVLSASAPVTFTLSSVSVALSSV